MAESLADTLAKMRTMVSGLPEFGDRVGTMLALDAKQMVQDRVQERGADASGSPLVDAKSGRIYSEARLPSGFFLSADPPLKPSQAKSMPPQIAYYEYKEAVGRFRGKRDLTLTGRMWKGTGIVAKESTEKGFVITVAGSNAETQGKLDHNSETSGVDVLEMAEQEKAELSATLDGELQIYLNSCGL